MRASILVMGPLLARYGGGACIIAWWLCDWVSTVDLHIRAMQKLGAIVELADGYVPGRTPDGLKGARLSFLCSVGATKML